MVQEKLLVENFISHNECDDLLKIALDTFVDDKRTITENWYAKTNENTNASKRKYKSKYMYTNTNKNTWLVGTLVQSWNLFQWLEPPRKHPLQSPRKLESEIFN